MTIGEFLLQALGFFLQTYPIAVLSFVPFLKKELLFSRKKIYLFLLAALILISFCFAVVCKIIYLPTKEDNQLLHTVSNLYMCSFIFLYIIGFFLIIRTEIIKKILILVMLIHYEAILYTTISIINGLLNSLELIPEYRILIVYGTNDILLNFLLLFFTFPAVCLFLKRVVQPCLPVMTNQILRRGCLYLLGTLLLFSVCIFSLSNFYFYYGVSGYPTILFLLAFTLTDVIIYYMFFTEAQLFSENQELENQLRSFDEDYQKISTSINEARRARHDLRYHLDMISTLHREKKDKELTEYLSRYESFSQELNEMLLSGYPSLDIVLSFYIQRAKEEGIAVEADIQPFRKNLEFDVIDLTVLIGNMMENAMDACHTSGSAPYIRIWMRLGESALLLKIENSCSPNIQKTQGYTDGSEFISTKHTALHGQGLKSIRYVAEKYGGSAEFKQNDGVFTVRIVLNIP